MNSCLSAEPSSRVCGTRPSHTSYSKVSISGDHHVTRGPSGDGGSYESNYSDCTGYRVCSVDDEVELPGPGVRSTKSPAMEKRIPYH